MTNNGGKSPLMMSVRPGMMKRRRSLNDSISEGKFTKEVGSHPHLKNSDVEYFCMTVKDLVFHENFAEL